MPMICNFPLYAIADLRRLELEHRALVVGEREQLLRRCPGLNPDMPLSSGAGAPADLTRVRS